MHPKELQIGDFTYHLPEEKIARFPLAQRDESRLLVYKSGILQENIFRHLADHLPPGALLLFNNTRVVAARLLFQKPTGGIIEIFALEPHHGHYDVAFALKQQGKIKWQCLIGGAGKWKRGQVLQKRIMASETEILLEARIVERGADSFTIEFNWEPAALAFAEILHHFGEIPIPPYLKRTAADADTERYQTIYAVNEGSVAAPTAGLHFTDTVFASLREKQIQTAFITLHVGAGTFMPVKAAVLGNHNMHEELIDVPADVIRQFFDHTQRIFAVGTTSLRAIESLYWMGLKCLLNPDITYSELEIKQWEVYELAGHTEIGASKAMTALLTWLTQHSADRLVIKTQILIAPSYKLKMATGIITNFHQPGSTLLLLVAAVIGDDWKKVYEYALENDFRFLSYGDGCLFYAH